MFEGWLFVGFPVLSFLLLFLFLLFFVSCFHGVVKFKAFFMLRALGFRCLCAMIRIRFKLWFFIFLRKIFLTFVPLNFIEIVSLPIDTLASTHLIFINFFVLSLLVAFFLKKSLFFLVELLSFLENLIFFLNGQLFYQFCNFALDVDCHRNDRMVLNVRDFELFNWNDNSEVGFQQFLINREQVVFLVKLKIFEQLQDPFELLLDVLFRQGFLFV